MRFTLSLFLLMLAPFIMMAQAPVANFSASVTTGCSPLGVSFTDLSTGTPTSWNWDFGNGQLSNLKNPFASFNPGTYTVTLTVRNSNGVNSITKTDFIVSNLSPSANFTADKTTTCLPANIQYTDLSVANAGTIVKWEWDLGDKTTSSVPSPAHQYTATGYYSIYLTVTSSTGCKSSAGRPRYIRILNGVKANFDYSGPPTCQPPFVLTYNNLTSGPGTISYTWDLGNGNSSNLTAPTAIYNPGGAYTVKLKAQSSFGCADSIQKNINVTGNNVTFNSPANVCEGSAALFQSTTVPTPAQVRWDFGDGSGSNQFSPSKIYNAPGTYTVKLYSTFGSCSDSAIKTIVVKAKPVVDFSASKTSSCQPPAVLTFQNLSAGVISAAWNFGDGGTSNSASPTVPHTYNTLGTYNVNLTVTDNNGCSNTLTKPAYIIIARPVFNMKNLPKGACINQTISVSPDVTSPDGIASYSWDFGDGSPIVNGANASHAYAAPGNYPIKLTVTTNDGCTDFATSPIRVGSKPALTDFSVNKTSDCGSQLFTFTNLSTAGFSAATWDFGDGVIVDTLLNPFKHKFADTGFHSIKLKVVNNGCSDSTTKMNLVKILPPVANFGYKVDCSNKGNVTFIDSSKVDPSLPPLTYLWNFGDPANNTSTAIPPAPVTNNYPVGVPATYNVKLIINNGSCPDTIIKKIQIVNEPPNFTINKPAVCRNEKVILSSVNTAAIVKKYQWMIDGVITTDSARSDTSSFTVTGTHTARLVITDINGCVDTSTVKTFVVQGATAVFGVANNGGCSNRIVTFSDSSVSTGTLTKWTFDFGDGKIQSFTAAPFTHVYADTGLYKVKLILQDNIGCIDTGKLDPGVTITKAQSLFTTLNQVYCPGSPLQFIDTSTGKGLTYKWSFGDGGIDSVANPVHTYTGKDSTYTVKLIVKDYISCSDTITKPNYIKISSPKALYSVKDTITLCPPLETKFYFKGKNYESFLWDFGDGSADPSSLDTTSHFYNTFGHFIAKLYVYGFGGCVDSASININVTDPNAATTSVTFNPKTACNELLVNFNVVTPFGTTFQFYPGDGSVDSTQQTSFQHFYNLPNLYSPSILLLDQTGCQAGVGGFGNVDIKGAVPIFGIDKNKFCDSGVVNFSDYSQEGRDPIISKTWDFGDGTPPVVLPAGATHNYALPGLYVPKLTTLAASNCTSVFTDTIRVLATPKPLITSLNGICNNSIIDFSGSLLNPPDTAIVWKWDLSNGLSSSQQNVSLNYPDTGLHHITLQATNSLGCKGDTAKNIMVYPVPVITVTGDTTIFSGTPGISIPLAYSANASAYNWTPPTNLSCTDCANPFAAIKFTTTYNVKVTDVNGCITKRNITLIVLCNDKNFFIPNTFSPNNDGANDRFYPRGKGLERIQALRIFNRWGELVFEKRNFPANDAASGWDGTYKGKRAESDAYIYMIDIICENATVITYKGNITLIR